MENLIDSEVDNRRGTLIETLTKELPALRTYLGIKQDDLAKAIGVSRQTYNSIETGKREMSWTVFVALTGFFLQHERTKQVLNRIPLFMDNFNKVFNVPLRSVAQQETERRRKQMNSTILLFDRARAKVGEITIDSQRGQISMDWSQQAPVAIAQELTNLLREISTGKKLKARRNVRKTGLDGKTMLTETFEDVSADNPLYPAVLVDWINRSMKGEHRVFAVLNRSPQ